MNAETIDYLEHFVASLTRVVKEYAANLKKQQNDNAMKHVQSHMRGSLRAYAEVVGHTRSDIMKAKGIPTSDRDKLHEIYLALCGEADDAGDKLARATSPLQISKLAIECEAIERRADELVVIYALDDVVEVPTFTSGLVN